jgi:hypothetical protein
MMATERPEPLRRLIRETESLDVFTLTCQAGTAVGSAVERPWRRLPRSFWPPQWLVSADCRSR